MSMCIRMRVSISWIQKVIYQLEIVKHVCWKWMLYSNQSLHFMLYYIVNESLRSGWLFYSLNSPTKPAWKAKDKAFRCISWFHWKPFKYIISKNTGRNNNGMSIERYLLWTLRIHVAFQQVTSYHILRDINDLVDALEKYDNYLRLGGFKENGGNITRCSIP